MSTADPAREILCRLKAAKATSRGQWQARCPAHEDNKASLSIKRGDDGRALLHCHAGCAVKDICKALGITEAVLFPKSNSQPRKPQIVATYGYRNELGELLYQAVRYSPKAFRQRRPDGKGGWLWNMKGVRRVLYRLPELIAADKVALVCIAEGEKDVERLARAGLVATCNVGGAGKWKPQYNEHLRGRRVCVIADKDKAGRDHAAQVAKSLRGVAAEVRVIELPNEKVKDAYDWFEAGGSVEALNELVQRAVPFDPKQAQDQQEDVANGGDGDVGEDETEKKEERFSQAQLLVNLAADVELWHDDDTAYGTIKVEDHRENHPINGKGFRSWLARQFWQTFKKVPGAQALQDALGVLGGKAQYEGQQRTVFVRVAEHDGAIYLDLAGEDWRVVKVTARGWELVEQPPVMFIRKRGMLLPSMLITPSVPMVMFIRKRGMLPLPSPVRGGSVDELRRFINVKEDRDFVLIVAWLVAALRGRGPYPVQALYGEQGSCKSTAQKMQRALVDPNKSPLRSEPREPRDLMIAANNSLVVGFDNLSNVPMWLSDALCRLSTGGGFSTRQLYSDADEMIFDAMRPLMFNGIEDVATRPDLLDRSVLIALMPISESDRRPESELWRDFHEARPRILAALLDAVAVGLAKIEIVKLDRLPRMADFATWVTACEPGLGWKPGTFIQAYMGNRAAANDSAIESSAIGALMVKLMENRDSFIGITKELMEAVEAMLPTDNSGNAKLPGGWPKSARAFSGELRRIAPNLRAAGINVAFGAHTRRGTPITLERLGKTPSPSPPPSPASRDNGLGGDGMGDVDGDPQIRPSPRNLRCDSNDDGGDERDGEVHSHSEADE
jgi:5S rRNA maturation endonuclease (ribonuclease M5)